MLVCLPLWFQNPQKSWVFKLLKQKKCVGFYKKVIFFEKNSK